MPNIRLHDKQEYVWAISNLGHPVHIPQEKLDKWNRIYKEWWEMQLEMDKVVKQQNG